MRFLGMDYRTLAGLVPALALAPACATDRAELGSLDRAQATGVEFVFEPITSNTTWTASNTYVLVDNIFVRNATLTIEPGTVVLGESGSSLVVSTTARLEAAGTADRPIVFTSRQEAPQPGDWGGVVLLGRAPINVAGGVDNIEGLPAGTGGAEYGGNDTGHDCGTLRYARIQYAGFELSPDNELNGLTVGGCGTGTELDYIQVHKGADDGIEFFGGTADLRHAIVTQPDDDGLDWDFGWTGKAQFLIVQQNSLVGNAGIEADNNKNNNDATPRSSPLLSNVTLIGSHQAPGTAGKVQEGLVLRRGTAGRISNLILAYFTDTAIDVDGAVSAQLAAAGQLAVTSSIFFGNGGWPSDDDDGGLDEESFFVAGSNRVVDPQLAGALDLSAPRFAPAAGSPALVGGATPPAGLDQTATFVGAVGTNDWTRGWTAYP
jgi:hypothetical protein